MTAGRQAWVDQAQVHAQARVAVVNLGCRVNRVEIDLIANRLQRAGCVIVPKEEADAVVVNTCAVTGEAQTKTRKAVRNACNLPQLPVVVATGCVANLFANELHETAPGVIIEQNKALVPSRVLEALGRGEDYVDDSGVLAVSPTPTGRTRPGIKIQDGCNNRCTYCIVWKARGEGRSISSDAVVEAVLEAQERKAHEVVLTGINLGSYRAGAGDALGEGAGLSELLELLLARTSIERIRLSSIEPPDVTDELLRVMRRSKGRVAPFLHVCLQSGCDATLARMGRVYDTGFFRDMVARTRASLHDVVLGTDLIVGFPGETDAEFEDSLAFCEKMSFARMHVFRYSKRPGTPAAIAPDQVSAPTVAERSARMRELATRMRDAHMRGLVGSCDSVLVQSAGRAVSAGLFDVRVDPRLPVGELVSVRFTCVRDGLLVGEAE